MSAFPDQGSVTCDAVSWVTDDEVFRRCEASATADTLLLATARAAREGWETIPSVEVIDGVPRQCVKHYCPQHRVGAR